MFGLPFLTMLISMMALAILFSLILNKGLTGESKVGNKLSKESFSKKASNCYA